MKPHRKSLRPDSKDGQLMMLKGRQKLRLRRKWSKRRLQSGRSNLLRLTNASRRRSRRRRMLTRSLLRNLRKSSYSGNTWTPMQLWLKKRLGTSWREVLNAFWEITRTRSWSTNANSMAFRLRIRRFGLRTSAMRSAWNWHTIRTTKRDSRWGSGKTKCFTRTL